MENLVSLAKLAAWSGLWGAGGILLALRLFHLPKREQVLVGIGLGLVVEVWLANLLGHFLPASFSFWLGAALTLGLGIGLSWPLGKVEWKAVFLPSIGPLIVFVALVGLFTLIGRGLPLYDDTQTLPTTSLLATGDIPPHFPLDPDLRYKYHYFLLLFAAQMMRIGNIYTWTALDIARSVVIALTILLAGLFTLRLTRSRVGGFLGGFFMAFSGGARWLLLLLPSSAMSRIAEHVQVIESSAQGPAGSSLVATMLAPWFVEGGPFPFPFAFIDGINDPAINMLTGICVMDWLILLLLVLVARELRGWKSWLVTVILLASLALANEVPYLLLLAGFGLAFLVKFLAGRFRLPRSILPWIAVLLLSLVVVLFQGGVLTDTARGLLLGQADTNLAIEFRFAWPPAFVSELLGSLSLFNGIQLFVALLELGVAILVLPLVGIWGWKAIRREKWNEATICAAAIVSLGMVFVQIDHYNGGITPTMRLYNNLLFACELYAVGLAWAWLRRRKEALRVGAIFLGLLACLNGLIVLGVQMIAIQQPVLSDFLEPLDAKMQQAYWDRLEPGALIFDPAPGRAPVVFGRPTRSSLSWNENRPDWTALAEAPSPRAIQQAGFQYVYFSEINWEGWNTETRDAFNDPCVRLVNSYEYTLDNGQFTFRRLLDVSGCR